MCLNKVQSTRKNQALPGDVSAILSSGLILQNIRRIFMLSIRATRTMWTNSDVKHSPNVLENQTRSQNSAYATRNSLIFRVLCILFEYVPLGLIAPLLINETLVVPQDHCATNVTPSYRSAKSCYCQLTYFPAHICSQFLSENTRKYIDLTEIFLKEMQGNVLFVRLCYLRYFWLKINSRARGHFFWISLSLSLSCSLSCSLSLSLSLSLCIYIFFLRYLYGIFLRPMTVIFKKFF